MSYEVNYDELPTEEKQHKACLDILQYMGDAQRYRNLVRAVRFEFNADTLTFKHFRMTMMMLAGIQGYPVRAFWERYIGALTEEELN